MSFKSKMLAAAATLTLVGGAAATLASGPANAATPPSVRKRTTSERGSGETERMRDGSIVTEGESATAAAAAVS